MGFYKWIVFFFVLFLSLGSVSASDDVDFGFDVNETFLDDVVVDDSFSDLSDGNYGDEEGLSFNRSGDFGFGDLNSSGDGDAGVQANIGTVITASGLTKYFGESATLYAYLKKSNGDPLSGKTLKFKIHGVTYSRTTNSNGRAGLGINLYPGTYTCQISFSASGYTSSSKSVTVTVNTAPTTLNSQGLVKMYGEAATWYAYLYDRNNNPLSGINLSFTIHGVTYNRTTNSNGRAGLEINLYPNNYTGKVSVAQRGYASSSKNVNIQVNPIPVSFEVNNLVKYYGETGYLKAYLKDNNNLPIMGETVLFSINGRNYNNTTDAEGCAVLPINLYPKNYTANVTLNNKPYGSPTKTVDVIVKPTPVRLDAFNQTCVQGTNLPFYLKNRFGNPLTGESIVFTVNNVNYTYITDSNGKVNLPMNFPLGEYDIRILFNKSYHEQVDKLIHVSVLNSGFPTINVTGGCYNLSNLTIGVSLNSASYFNYSWDNVNWTYSDSSKVFALKSGEYDFYYKGNNNVIFHEHYVIDNKSPVVWSNYNSDIYNNSILINLSSWDNVDENLDIYYSINESTYQLYQNPFTVSSTTLLRFYSKDFMGHSSSIVKCNYIFERVGNLNSGKGFSTIQSAINDEDTLDGDIIKVSSGLYQEMITVNKSLNLIANTTNCVLLQGINSSHPIIGVTPEGNNSLIYGFRFIDSDFGVLLLNTSDVTVLSNSFHNVANSFGCDGDTNTLFMNNTITSDYMQNMNGLIIRYSNNLTIINNTIELNSNQYSVGIFSQNISARNIVIAKNKITSLNPKNSIGLYLLGSNLLIESNSITNLNVGVYIGSMNNSLVFNNSINNNNNALFLEKSVNNTYKTNNLFDNIDCGVLLSETMQSNNDSFYLNRLCDNGRYDFCSLSNVSYVINDNWWGENTPKISTALNIFANVYNSTGNLILDSWIVMSYYSASYSVNDASYIARCKFYLDMSYNNLGEDLSGKGHLPDNVGVYFMISDANQYYQNIIYLYDSLAFVDVNVMDFSNVSACLFVMDNDNCTFIFNKKASIEIFLISDAIDVDTNSRAIFDGLLDYSSVDWITYSWSETGLYAGVINVIVNGEIIKTINVTNANYLFYKNEYGENVFRAMKMYNNIYASMKEGVWEPNGLFFNFIQYCNLHNLSIELIPDLIESWLKQEYSLTNNEFDFISQNSHSFVDKIHMGVDYHGSYAPKIRFNYDGEDKLLNPPSSYALRSSNIYYTDITDENDVSIGYEGMRSFVVVRDNLTSGILQYWLNQKSCYSPGLMKSAYGTFLTSLLVIYENDRVADEAANRFNVTWQRISPACVSLCNDYNCLYITGESDHSMGREASGNSSDVWKFNFATSFSFSLVEQLVGNNVWNDTTIGSVTLELIQSYLNNETIEIITSNGHVIIKREGDNNTLLILDLETGIVRDYFSNYGLLGTMPCYHDNITENAWNYGNNIKNILSNEFLDLKVIFSSCVISSVFVEGLSTFTLESSSILGGALMGEAIIVLVPVFMFLFPDETNELWMDFAYLLNPNAREFPNITIYEGMDYNIQKLFKTKNDTILELNGKSLDDYIISQFIYNRDPHFNKNTDKMYIKRNNEKNKGEFLYLSAPNDGLEPPDEKNWTAVGKHIREIYDEFDSLESNSQKVLFLKSKMVDLITVSLSLRASESLYIIIYSLINWLLNQIYENNSNGG